MAILTVCVNKQRKRKDGCYSVYVRVAHNGKSVYMPTDKVVGGNGLSSSMEVVDPYVLKPLSAQIVTWLEALNGQEISGWSARQVADFLSNLNEDLVFSDYARGYIDRLIDNGQERNARNYRFALQHLERHFGTTQVKFGKLTSVNVNQWIASLSGTVRAKELYPVCIRQIFKAAQLEYNDYDCGLIRIKTNPWGKVKIPSSDTPAKRAISPEECREFFSAALPASRLVDPLAELGRDVAMMVLCLGGMNTVDIFELRKGDYRDGRICYRRAKTRKARRDGAYMEMRVEPIIQPLVEKYMAGADDEYLLNFHSRFATSDSFGANVNAGIKQVCKGLGIPKERWYCVYTFRHTWGTVAQNDCGASVSDVAFGMNHSHGHAVTRGYIRIDFTPAWELNAKVIDFIFFSTARSKQGLARGVDEPTDKLFRLSPKRMVYARAYFRGEVLAEVCDIGFGTIEEVIGRLAVRLPETIPPGCAVQFRIKDVDADREAVYERTKGKGF